MTGGRPRRAYRGSTCHDARAYSRTFRVFHSRSICVHAHHVCKCMNVDIHVCMLVRTWCAVCMHVFMHVYACLRVCVLACMRVCVHVCVHVWRVCVCDASVPAPPATEREREGGREEGRERETDRQRERVCYELCSMMPRR